MIKGKFEPVCDIKALSIDRFWDLIFKLMVKLWVLYAARISTLLSFACYLELEEDFLLFSSLCQLESLDFVFESLI